MTLQFTFTIPGKPGAKGRPRFSRKSGVAFTPEKTRNLEATIKLLAMQERGDRPIIDGPVRVHVCAQFEPPKSWSKKKQAAALTGEVMPTSTPDADNVAKAVTDACNGVLFRDDAQIVELFARKRYGVEANTFVTVAECT